MALPPGPELIARIGAGAGRASERDLGAGHLRRLRRARDCRAGAGRARSRGPEKARQRGGGGVVRVEGGKTPRRLDRRQDRVVVVGHGRDLATHRVRSRDDEVHAVVARRVVFIPRQQQDRVLSREGGRAEDGGDLCPEPRIAGRDRAVVHVVAHVGCDPRVAGRGRRAPQVGTELSERNDVGLAPAGVGADVVVVDERIVLDRVRVGVGGGAARGHALHVCLPAAA